MRSRFHPLIVLASLVAFVALLPAGYVATAILGIPEDARWSVALPAVGTVVVLANVILPFVWRLVSASSNATTWFSQKHGDKRVSISHVEALVAAGRYDDATHEMDALFSAHGLDRGLCLRAIDFHMGKFGSPSRAEALLRRMRAECPAEWEGFATQRLIDLYMTHIDSHAKAMTELRRMIARFPGTPEAVGAEACLSRLRAAAA